MAKVFGAKLHGDRLHRLSSSVLTDKIADAVERGVERIKARAVHSIIDGSVSGPDHVPSLPGQPPNADTHELDRSIYARTNRQTLVGVVGATSEAAVPLEFGTSQMAERPFLKPAAQLERPAARRDILDAVNKSNRGA